MPSFPTLSEAPDAAGWSEGPALDPTLRSAMENGLQVTRPRVTNVPKKWSFTYRYLPAADKSTLDAFQVAQGFGGSSFDWLNVVDGKTYTVRFAAPISFALEDSQDGSYQANVTLVEVRPNTGRTV